MKLFYFTLALFSGLVISACFFSDDTLKKTHSKNSIKQNIQKSEKSALLNYYSKEDLLSLKHKLNSDNFNMRIFGDSHMAADFFSRELRKNFIQVNSIGIVYPLQPKYQQVLMLDYESKDFDIINSRSSANEHYAVGGILARAKKANAYIKLSSNLKEQVFNVGIFYKAKDKGFVINDKKAKKYTAKKKNKNNFVYEEFSKLSFPITIKALEKNAELGAFIIYNDDKNVKTFDTLGINGARSDIWLRWDKDTMKKSFGVIKNDLIILAYGSNDALMDRFNKKDFKSKYKNFIHFLKKYNPNVKFILISPPTVTKKIDDETYALTPNFYEVRKAIYELAREEKIILFDMHTAMEQNGGKELWIEQGLSNKDVHLTVEGYSLLATKFQKDFEKLLSGL